MKRLPIICLLALTLILPCFSFVQASAEPAEDYSDVQAEWELQDGYYIAGIDIPAGVFDATAIKGIGNIYSCSDSANLKGPEHDGHDEYSLSFRNFRVEESDTLEVKGVQVKLTYSIIQSHVAGRTHDEKSAILFGPGNYIVGRDIPAGMYNVRFVSGVGGCITSDRAEGDFILFHNMDGDPETGDYVDLVSNILLVKDELFTVTTGLTVAFIPEA